MTMRKLGLTVYLAAIFTMAACAGTRDGKAAGPADASVIEPPAKMECMAEPSAVDNLLLAVQEALKSGDAARMREALGKTETHLAEMKEKMAKCKAKMAKAAAEGKPAEAMMCCKKKSGAAPVDSGAAQGGSDAPSGHVH